MAMVTKQRLTCPKHDVRYDDDETCWECDGEIAEGVRAYCNPYELDPLEAVALLLDFQRELQRQTGCSNQDLTFFVRKPGLHRRPVTNRRFATVNRNMIEIRRRAIQHQGAIRLCVLCGKHQPPHPIDPGDEEHTDDCPLK